MEPTAVSSLPDHAILATLMALALGVVKILEKVVTMAARRIAGDKESHTTVSLSAEPTRLLRETYEHSAHMDEIISIRDRDGIPLVYNPRSAIEIQMKIAEAIRDISQSTDHVALDQREISNKIDEILLSIKKPQ